MQTVFHKRIVGMSVFILWANNPALESCIGTQRGSNEQAQQIHSHSKKRMQGGVKLKQMLSSVALHMVP